MTIPSPATDRARDARAAAVALGLLSTNDPSPGKPTRGLSGGSVSWAAPVPVLRGPVADRGSTGATRSRGSSGRNVAPTGSFDQNFSGCEDQFPGNRPPALTGSQRIVKANLVDKSHDICNDNYAVKYSGRSLTPLVASEHITKTQIEQATALSNKRTNDFRADPRLKPEQRAELADYKGYLYIDRGHNAPHGDMPTMVSGSQSFFLSNMIPQAACHNEGLWERIESTVRAATGAGSASDPGREIYVATGPGFMDETVQLLNGRVSVPSHMWKAVYIPEKGTVGVYWTRNKNTNANGQPQTEKDVEVISIDELQRRTGIDVFPSITDPSLRNMATVPPITAQARFACRVHDLADANNLTTPRPGFEHPDVD